METADNLRQMNARIRRFFSVRLRVAADPFAPCHTLTRPHGPSFSSNLIDGSGYGMAVVHAFRGLTLIFFDDGRFEPSLTQLLYALAPISLTRSDRALILDGASDRATCLWGYGGRV